MSQALVTALLRMEAACFTIILFVAHIYFSSPKKKTFSHRLFAELIIVGLINVIFDGVTVYMVYNLLAAASVASLVGVDAEHFQDVLDEYHPENGRLQHDLDLTLSMRDSRRNEDLPNDSLDNLIDRLNDGLRAGGRSRCGGDFRRSLYALQC